MSVRPKQTRTFVSGRTILLVKEVAHGKLNPRLTCCVREVERNERNLAMQWPGIGGGADTDALLSEVLLRQAERPDGGLLCSFLQADGSVLAWSARELVVEASRILR